MATATKPQQSKYAKPATPKAPRGNQVFLFDKDNYRWMIAGVVLILIGFALMSGGKSPDPHKFDYDAIYSFRRITLAPIVILLGFAVEVYAIMKKPKETSAA
jgi:hypothetical protein